MLKVHVKYHLKPGTQADFLAGVTEKTLQDAVLNENGCLKYEYIPAEGIPDLVLLEEEWTSLQAQQTHLQHQRHRQQQHSPVGADFTLGQVDEQQHKEQRKLHQEIDKA